MSVLRLEDFNRDPFEYLRRLERLSKLDRDRVAFGRQQRAFCAVEMDAKTETRPLSVIEEQPK